MKLTRLLPLTLTLLTAIPLMGAEGGCQGTTIDITGDCGDLTEQECAASPVCELVETTALGLADQGAERDAAYPCDCAPCAEGEDCPCDCFRPIPEPPTTYECVPVQPDACADKNEAQCLADPQCEPEYVTVSCLMYCGENGDLCDPAPPCDTTSFSGCHDVSTTCPPVCDIYCPYGNVLDADGCATCGCNPAPTGCDGRTEPDCISDPTCQPVYGYGDDDPGEDCACAPCDPNAGFCEPCDCGSGQRPQPAPTYLACEDVPTYGCASLDEQQCLATPGCSAVYNAGGASGGSSSGSGASGSGDSGGPSGGSGGSSGDEDGARAFPCDCLPCDGDPDSCPCSCEVPPPPSDPTFAYCIDTPGTGCETLSEDQCIADPSCDPSYSAPSCLMACDPSLPSCDGAPPCPTEPVYEGCLNKQPECTNDADCPNGYCEYFASCLGTGCPPPPPPQCVTPSCDDGGPLMCRALPPTCGPSETAAIRNGCWECVDARSCQPTTGQCDNTQPGDPICAALPPACPPDTIVALRDGCWACVDPYTCQDVYCHDGSPVLCDMIPPTCSPGSTLAIKNGCYDCVNPTTCN